MDQLGSLKGVVERLPPQMVVRHPPQLVIDERHQLLKGLPVTLAPVDQQKRDLLRCVVFHLV